MKLMIFAAVLLSGLLSGGDAASGGEARHTLISCVLVKVASLPKSAVAEPSRIPVIRFRAIAGPQMSKFKRMTVARRDLFTEFDDPSGLFASAMLFNLQRIDGYLVLRGDDLGPASAYIETGPFDFDKGMNSASAVFKRITLVDKKISDERDEHRGRCTSLPVVGPNFLPGVGARP